MKRLGTDQSGMTLIDIAIVMMVVGLLLAPALETYKQWKYEKETGTTISNRLAIHKAMADFYFTNGFYPCPADATLGPGNAAYGDSDCAATNIGGGVSIGAVPFATLQIPPEMSLDGWSSKLTYAVTSSLTTAATFNPVGGTLRVRGLNSLGYRQCETIAVHDIDTAVHYVLVSHGPSGLGARSAEGTPKQACPALANGADAENCINNNTFIADNCMVSNATNTTNFYDDMVDYKNSIPTRLWMFSPVDANDIFAGNNIEAIGINNNNPQTEIDVIGNIRATNNSTQFICDENDTNCFSATLIDGYDPIMNCTSGTSANGMSGIRDARASCNMGYSVSSTLCPSGEYVMGIDAAGAIICGT